MLTRYRFFIAALIVAAAAVLAPSRGVPATLAVAAAQHAEPAAAQPAAAHEAARGEHEAAAESGWTATIAKIVNFAILVGVLVYFLRAPIAAYLTGRISKVREDLVTAAQTREAASRQLAEIDARLKALPADIESLKRRGAEDLAAERVRIEQAAETERVRLLEHTRREIEMRLRVAKRELIALTADLAVGVAAQRITQSITPADQARMIDRYATQLTGTGPGRETRQ